MMRQAWIGIMMGVCLGLVGEIAAAGTAGDIPLPGGTELAWRSYVVPQAARAYHNLVALPPDYNSALMIGGYGLIGTITVPVNPETKGYGVVGFDAWSSMNGSQWFRAGDPGPATSRFHAGLVELNSMLYLVGGQGGSEEDTFSTGQVWSSSDGANWTLLTDTAPWGPRQNMAVAAFDGKIWVIGGMDPSASETPGSPGFAVFPPDIWSSSDGRAWELVTPSAPWGGCFGSQAVVFNNQLWLVGGLFTGPYGVGVKASETEVWYTYDGLNWY
ncbi:MAG TPA: hypothetical protein PKX28_04120, partial [Candidatus Hydrogenedentes bacterium]|nr:hypothetical protein [Candidatus Hydrogenedentota bacterium]